MDKIITSTETEKEDLLDKNKRDAKTSKVFIPISYHKQPPCYDKKPPQYHKPPLKYDNFACKGE